MKTNARLLPIENAAKAYADKRNHLEKIVKELNYQIDLFARNAMPEIKRALSGAAASKSSLSALVDANRDLFESPRTVIFHGIKVGLRKGAGGVSWDNADQVIKLIEKRFSDDEAKLLIKTTKKPIKKALQALDVAELRHIGCTVESTGDEIVVSPIDSEVDKIVTALLKAADESAEEKEAA